MLLVVIKPDFVAAEVLEQMLVLLVHFLLQFFIKFFLRGAVNSCDVRQLFTVANFFPDDITLDRAAFSPCHNLVQVWLF